MLLFVRPLAGLAEENAALEYKVKAGFLFNFAKFTEWPTNVLAVPGQPIVIGVLDDDPAAPVLEQALADKTVNGRRLVVKRFGDGAALGRCQIFFISRAQKQRVSEILERLGQAPVLTVGEVEQFAQRGGMINFVRREDTFRFEINLQVIEKAGLKVSGKLASMAIPVQSRK